MILFELLIALSLIAILVTFLFSFFVQNAKIERKMDTVRMHVSKRGYLQTRLQNIFSSLDRGSLNSSFYTKQLEKEDHLNLIIQFDNGIDPDPNFSGVILGKIYLDGEKNLNLVTWPITKEKQKPWRSEILYSKVKGFEFEFLGPNTPVASGSGESKKPINEHFAWRSHWNQAYGSTPTMVRLTVYEEEANNKVCYAFSLPVSEIVSYREAS